LADKKNRTKLIAVRVNDDEHQAIQKKAEACNVHTSTFIRELALDKKMSSRVDQNTYIELRKQTTNLSNMGNMMLWFAKHPENTNDTLTLDQIKDFRNELASLRNEIRDIAMQVLKELQS